MPAKRMEDIAAYMKQMKFRRKTFGGVDEADVWRQLEGQANGEDWQNGRVPW